MASSSSWHPAFMPNSAADIIKDEPSPPSDSLSLPLSSEPTEVKPIPLPSVASTHEALAHEHENRLEQQPATEDTSGHAELDDLRHALTTSLASPGGVELEENPLHNGEPHTELSQHDKSDFPSEGPVPPSKHLSTMSFARTVSEEVNWAEDDEIDPEWTRTGTDPFKLMAESGRTNSFPAVPPAHNPAVNFAPPQSQVEEIMNGVGHTPKDLFGEEDGGDEDFFGQQSNTWTEPDSQTMQEETNDQDEEIDARYEEGLPLVQPTEYPPETPSADPSAFMDDGEDQDDFFNQVGQSEEHPSESSAEPPPLERKSTVQVMDSLNYHPHEHVQDMISEEEPIESSQSSLDKATGGGIASSKSTIVSQVFGDTESSLSLPDQEEFSTLNPEPEEEDLAAKWKAALDGDEFLDDDEDFLPDDEPATGKPLDPTDLFGSDDEGFLDDVDPNTSADPFSQQMSTPFPAPTSSNGHVAGLNTLTGSTAQTARPGSSSERYVPVGAQTTAQQPSNPYAPSAPQFTDLSGSATSGVVPSPYGAPSYGVTPAIGNFNQKPQPPRPEMPKTAQSFADKSKGGYSSPYDLPMDVVRPRKRPSMQQIRAPAPPAAPPRSASMFTQPQPPPRGPTSSLSPPSSSHSQQNNPQYNVPSASQTVPPSLKSKSSFFEELPMSLKSRATPRPSSAMSSQSHNSYTPTDLPQPYPPLGNYSQPPQQQQQQQQSQPPISNHTQGLVTTGRVSPYTPLPSNSMPVPATDSQYSSAPTQPQTLHAPPPPAAGPRHPYAPPPPNRQTIPAYNGLGNGIPPPMLPHQPRTSSPLAQHSHDMRSSSSQSLPSTFDRRASSSYDSNLKPRPLPPTREVDESEPEINGQPQFSQPPANMQLSQTPPPPQGLTTRLSSSPSKRAVSNYLPQQPQNRPSPPQGIVPPMRSQTQSPGSAYTGPRLDLNVADMHKRPASVETPTSPRGNANSMPNLSAGRPRGFSQAVNYIAPIDGREHDQMQRWKGAPVLVWGVGGTLITSFPKDVPRYGVGSTMPMIIRSPGEMKIRNIKDVDPLPERLTSFPGPLKGKSKKKDVISWLTSGIQILEQDASYLRGLSTLTHEDKRTEERILLWKILRVFIEQDGILEGNTNVDKAVRAVLSPGLEEEFRTSVPLYATGADFLGISQSSTAAARADPVDATAVDQLRKHLLRGHREKAVWEAVDKRLWAHAMLISNTVSKDLYKQVAQEFVQKEVKNIGDNTESLAALYEVFAGNFEESIDELVPVSARAGFQMVSTSSSTGSSKDALDGLDRWRETLGLILSNRSAGDSQALNALGKLLSGYGRAEAAHICFLFARTYTIFDGIDNPAATMVLVGSDHLRQPYQFDKEMEPILLSEVFEYGTSLSSTSNALTSSPHLSIYKLQHALILGEYGYREKALQYCEAISAAMYSQTRKSPYHHALLASEVDDFTKRLKQSPKDEKASFWKPSGDNVTQSLWKWVAGEDSDTGTPGSATAGGTESGPFARISGNTPTMSRAPSNLDLYGGYNGSMGMNGTVPQASSISQRYGPGAALPATNEVQSAVSYQSTSSYGSQPRPSLEERSSGEFRPSAYEPIRRDSDYRPTSQPTLPNSNYAPQANSSYTPQSASYTPPTTNNQWSESGSPYSAQQLEPPSAYGPYSSNTFNSPQPATYTPVESSYGTPTSSGYEPPSTGGYEPPSSSYEPPSYEPATMNDEPDSPVDTRTKKKSFMDDDGDEYSRPGPASAGGEKTKAEKDREADEAFRKAAEADGTYPTL
jgi:hypothetical protein